MHNYEIKNSDNKSLNELMEQYKKPIPEHWIDENEMTIFDKAYFGIIPNIEGHKSDE